MLDITIAEKKALINVINYVINELNDELSIRTGFSLNEYKIFLEILKRDNLRNYIFNKDQLQMLHQAFNEIINGIFIFDFEVKIGLTIKEAKEIFESLSSVIDGNIVD